MGKVMMLLLRLLRGHFRGRLGSISLVSLGRFHRFRRPMSLVGSFAASTSATTAAATTRAGRPRRPSDVLENFGDGSFLRIVNVEESKFGIFLTMIRIHGPEGATPFTAVLVRTLRVAVSLLNGSRRRKLRSAKVPRACFERHLRHDEVLQMRRDRGIGGLGLLRFLALALGNGREQNVQAAWVRRIQKRTHKGYRELKKRRPSQKTGASATRIRTNRTYFQTRTMEGRVSGPTALRAQSERAASAEAGHHGDTRKWNERRRRRDVGRKTW